MLVEPRTPGLTYDVDEWNGQLIVLTDADGAADFKLMTTPEASPGRSHWKELVPHCPGRFIAAVHPFAGQLVREQWRDANPRLVVMHADGSEKEIAFEEPAYAISVPPGQSWSSGSSLSNASLHGRRFPRTSSILRPQHCARIPSRRIRPPMTGAATKSGACSRALRTAKKFRSHY